MNDLRINDLLDMDPMEPGAPPPRACPARAHSRYGVVRGAWR